MTYFAMSHYHSDHTANANAFAASTWIVQKAERDWMLADTPQGIVQPDTYGALRTAKTRILDNEDLDVFGDGAVRVIATPGHTPGHQVVFVRLARLGPVILAGDLYHYPEEITTGRITTSPRTRSCQNRPPTSSELTETLFFAFQMTDDPPFLRCSV